MSWDKVNEDIESGPWGAAKWFIILIVFLVAFLGVINFAMRPANVAVDRIVTKTSFQYKEGMEQRAATLQANIAELDMLIIKHPERRDEFLAQRRFFEAQLRAITINDN